MGDVPGTDEISQKGFSLPEALIAAFLLSVSILGLLNYYQSLTYGFMRQWQVQQAWSEAHSQLEAYAATGRSHETVMKGWEYQLSEISAGQSCQRVNVVIRSPAKYQAILQRLICKSGG
ncbi:prepilin-type N-terminal cleavage/methylation domain-containing protein [Rahnella sikkimica]|uniref:Prepilin-type N-terminal cleavage/methylation domain-containing protein n=1 Tax=Rahnella sikkimica TaxID=1805933 RepID=A0A2L1UWG2_9GAMM|nr:prepilin-type N-terminal cleavage/methylation domain-containing protein [Rahnella sikkimica]AVF37247.1 prepilin-type N-terminal cleavage/methylation domain-containing protein [Rahnella sikkimica]